MTAQMLRGKLHLPHLHHWVPMIFNLSRTIQWLREAAQLSGEYETDRMKRGAQSRLSSSWPRPIAFANSDRVLA
jgi:hypothetical protein